MRRLSVKQAAPKLRIRTRRSEVPNMSFLLMNKY